MSVFTSIDLSELPPPTLVEELDYEKVLAATKNELQMIAPDLDVDNLLESDPISKLLQVMAYRELHLRQRINESARGVMLATASGGNLDHLAALVNIKRLVIEPGDPAAGIEAQLEDDERLRARTQLAFEGFSTAGPRGAYIFHALSASAQVKDVAVYSERPGEVEVRVLSHEGDGQASSDLIDTVARVLNADEIRPLTDRVKVKSAEIVPYTVSATVVLSPGIGGQEVLAAAETSVVAFMDKHRRLGVDITRAGLIAALYQSGVQNVLLHTPGTDLFIERDQAPAGGIGTLAFTEQASAAPFNMPAAIHFTPVSAAGDQVAGTIELEPAEDELDITHYQIYWAGNNAQKLPLSVKNYRFVDDVLSLDHDNAEHLLITSLDGSSIYIEDKDYRQEGNTLTALNAALNNTTVRINYQLPPLATLVKGGGGEGGLAEGGQALHYELAPTPLPRGATHLIAFSANEFGEMLYGVSVELFDGIA